MKIFNKEHEFNFSDRMATKCAGFLKEVESRFKHFTSGYAWYGDNGRTYFDEEERFRQWLKKELNDPENRRCFDNSEDKQLKNIKEQFKGQL